jgi:hypothetical protein
LLITPSTSYKPSQQSQHRFSVSFGHDRLFSIVKQLRPLLLRSRHDGQQHGG